MEYLVCKLRLNMVPKLILGRWGLV